MKTVYLAGGIAGLSDAQCNDWRDYATKELEAAGYQTLNPMRRDYRGYTGEAYAKEVVEFDKADINASDIVLAMAHKPSWGTAMEILYSWEQKKDILAIVAPETSPWIIYHTTERYLSLEEALYVLIEHK